MHEHPSKHDPITYEAIRLAHQLALDRRFQVGAIVGHIGGDPIAYELRHIDDDADVATLGYFDGMKGKDVVVQCPLGDLFDPKVAFEIALSIKQRNISDATSNN